MTFARRKPGCIMYSINSFLRIIKMNRKAYRYNSKLSTAQKIERRRLKGKYSTTNLVFFSFPELGVTIAALPAAYAGDCVAFGVSVMSEREKKFRRKVGEYYALVKLDERTEFIQHVSGFDFEEWAEKRAQRVSRIVVNAASSYE